MINWLFKLVDQCQSFVEKCLECDNNRCEYWYLVREENNEAKDNRGRAKSS